MDKNLWEALNSIDLTISKIVSLIEVLELHQINNKDMICILEELIVQFSDNNEKVWNEMRKIYGID